MSAILTIVKTCVRDIKSLFPVDPFSIDFFDRMGYGEVVQGEFVRKRDYIKHKKFFALLKVGYEFWTPAAVPDPFDPRRWIVPEKSMDAYREHVIVKCGYYVAFHFPDGSCQVRAKSISFGSMGQDEFDTLYDNAITVIMSTTQDNLPRADYERAAAQIMDFI